MGVASDSFGAFECMARLSLGTSAGTSPWPETGLTLGEGGIPRVSLGVRVPLELLPPGWGARNKGTGDDMLIGVCGGVDRSRVRFMRRIVL